MDPFTAIMVGITVALIVALVLIGLFHPKSGADVLGWRPTRSAELEAQNELDDLAQMLDAANERRRRRGKAERTLEQVEQSVILEQEERVRRSDDHLARQDVEQMLAVKNERRARKGLPPLSAEDYRARLGLD